MSTHNVFGTGALEYVPSDFNDASNITVGNLFYAEGSDWSSTGARIYIRFTGGSDIKVTLSLWTNMGDFPATPAQSKTITLTNSAGWYDVTWDASIPLVNGADFIVGYRFPDIPNVYSAATFPPITAYQARDDSLLFMAGGSRGRYKDGDGSVTSTAAWYGIDVTANQGTVIPLSVNVGLDRTIQANGTISLTAAIANGSGTPTYTWTKISGPTGTFSAASSATTDFMPTSTGDYILQCLVTDDTGTRTDEMVLSVTTDPAMEMTATPATVTDDSDWTKTPTSGMTSTDILSDNDDQTYLTSLENASSQPLVVEMNPIAPPLDGQALILNLTIDSTASNATVLAKLYEGLILRSTSSARPVPHGDAAYPVYSTLALLFPATDIANITSWDIGLTVHIEVTDI